MKPLTCAAVRRRLHAYHDRELPIGDEIAVGAHLEWCGECAGEAAELRFLRSALQAVAPARLAIPPEDIAGFTASVVNRIKAERDRSFVARTRLMFDDMHLVYAGLGAAVATLVCVVVMLGMMHFATAERPDSLAAIMSVLGVPVDCETTADSVDQAGCRERWSERFQRASESAEQDAVFALDSAVTHPGGRLANLQLLKTRGRDAATAADLEELLDAACRARLEMQPAPSLTTSSVVRFMARETVRASKSQPGDLALPTTTAGSQKKRTV
jgi:anti-sigma factor RsiW